ncbi:hypothetical protein B0J13DRAFT_612882 [Dactylonectria estremocensis]|uniref:Zn(2)-C6 fungal-type domain-containing protein n=1 Tax=Dactylonectria estremocensis TaxID=1079267 RepID=A0A9P9DJ38_9HYPO|nr:hypothetical protein B0J13DRAFT_612882 [Dactylonectria estremocensis]
MTPIQSDSSVSESKRRRSARACLACRKRKVRCDVTQDDSCTNCQLDGITCEIAPRQRRQKTDTRRTRYAGMTSLDQHNSNPKNKVTETVSLECQPDEAINNEVLPLTSSTPQAEVDLLMIPLVREKLRTICRQVTIEVCIRHVLIIDTREIDSLKYLASFSQDNTWATIFLRGIRPLEEEFQLLLKRVKPDLQSFDCSVEATYPQLLAQKPTIFDSLCSDLSLDQGPDISPYLDFNCGYAWNSSWGLASPHSTKLKSESQVATGGAGVVRA